MENKYNIDDVNAWLKDEYGMSYDELSKEFNKAVDLLSESLKQRKEMRDKINKANEFINHYETIRGYYEYEECGYDEYNYDEDLKDELLDILKEDK